jgi:hypothetical protein
VRRKLPRFGLFYALGEFAKISDAPEGVVLFAFGNEKAFTPKPFLYGATTRAYPTTATRDGVTAWCIAGN